MTSLRAAFEAAKRAHDEITARRSFAKREDQQIFFTHFLPENQ